jgi:hypothetical protein
VTQLLPKLTAGELPSTVAVRHSNVFHREPTSQGERLFIAPSAGHIELLLALAQLWKEDYYVLWVLLTPRLGTRPAGRYQSPGPLTFGEIAAFCREFRPFFEGDGRHHLWIGSTTGAGLLVYDRHEWIYAYGDLAAYEEVLTLQGLTEGDSPLPSPHSHAYNAAFDADEDAVAGYWEWRQFPLAPGDDD